LLLFSAKHSLDSISLKIVNRHAMELYACTSDRERSTRAGEACTSDRQPVNGNSDSYSCLCEHSLSLVSKFKKVILVSGSAVCAFAQQRRGQKKRTPTAAMTSRLHHHVQTCPATLSYSRGQSPWPQRPPAMPVTSQRWPLPQNTPLTLRRITSQIDSIEPVTKIFCSRLCWEYTEQLRCNREWEEQWIFQSTVHSWLHAFNSCSNEQLKRYIGLCCVSK